MSFKEVTLENILQERGYIRGPFGSALKRNEMKDAGIPVYEQQHAINNIRYFRFFIDDVKYEKLKRFTVLPNDLIISCSGTVGKISLIKENDPLGIISQALLILRVNTEKINPLFLYYFLISAKGQFSLLKASHGAVQQNIAPRNVVEKIEIPYPLLFTQNKIVAILNNLDRKIEKNNQINETLEAMAQAIFKSWFVDFDPVKAKVEAKAKGLDDDAINRAAMRVIASKTDTELDEMQAESPAEYANLQTTASHFPDELVESELGMIPKGWEVKELSKIIDFNPPRRIKKGELAPYVGMADIPEKGYRIDNFIYREMGSGARFINGDTLFARITPCLENGKTAYVDILKKNEVAWGSTEFIVMRPRIDISTSIAYLIARLDSFRSIAIQSMVGTSGRQRADRKTLEQIPWVVAPIEMYKLFGKFSNSYMNLAKSKHEENQSLIELRDSLLPKLLSGEIEV